MARTPFKMKGFSGFGNSPLKQDEKGKKKKVMTEAMRAHLLSKGLSKQEIEALVYKENRAATADTTGDYANKPVYRYEGLDYTQKEIDTAKRIKERKAKKAKKK